MLRRRCLLSTLVSYQQFNFYLYLVDAPACVLYLGAVCCRLRSALVLWRLTYCSYSLLGSTHYSLVIACMLSLQLPVVPFHSEVCAAPCNSTCRLFFVAISTVWRSQQEISADRRRARPSAIGFTLLSHWFLCCMHSVARFFRILGRVTSRRVG